MSNSLLKSILRTKNAAKLSYFFHFYSIFITFAYQKTTSVMNIGDKVRFLNDVGGGKITAFRPGGIVMVEDADGFEVPIPQNEVVVIEDAPLKMEKKKAVQKVEYGISPKPPITKRAIKPEEQSLNGKEYLQSKAVTSADEEPYTPEGIIDEQLEARIVRLELTIQKLEARIALLEAENNLRKNEKSMKRSVPSKNKPSKPTTLEDLQIL